MVFNVTKESIYWLAVYWVGVAFLQAGGESTALAWIVDRDPCGDHQQPSRRRALWRPSRADASRANAEVILKRNLFKIT